MVKRVIAVAFLAILGLLLFSATIRGTSGNLENVKTMGKLTAPGGPFESSHERAPYAEMLAIKNRHTIELGKDLADFGAPDVGYENNRYYSFFPSGIAVIALLGHTIGAPYNLGQVSAYMMMSLVSIGTMILMFTICRDIFKLPIWSAIAAPIVFAFATPAWSYSITIYQHAAAAFLSMLMFYLTWRYRQRGKYNLVWASMVWALYGLSFFFDYPNAIILMPVMLYFLLSSFRARRYHRGQRVAFTFNAAVLGTMIFFVLTAGYLGYHNTKYFGSWNIIANTLTRYTPGTKTVVAVVPHAERLSRVSRALTEELLPTGVQILLFGVDKGLFVYSPIMLMALLGYLSLWDKKRTMELGILATLPVFNLFVYASFGDPYGGWAFGPRYLVPAMASLSILSVIGLQGKKFTTIRRLVFMILFIVSSAIAAAGALTSNLIPPKVEADYLKIPYYNFVHNFDLIYKNDSASFIYNTVVHSYMSLEQYALIIWAALIAIMFCMLFVLPLFPLRNKRS
jgi:MFS family permease